MILTLILTMQALAADYRAMTERTLQLRTEVEAISVDLEADRKRRQSEIDALTIRKNELTNQVKKEELRTVQLEEKTRATRKRIAPRKTASKEELKFLADWIGDLESWISSSLPFRRKERLAEVVRFKERNRLGDNPEGLVLDLCAFIERELKLTKDNAFEIASLPLADGDKKAEVARIGMIHMAFVTDDGKAGFARLEQGQWRNSIAQSSAEEAAARRIVAKFKEKKQSGYFEVPNFYQLVN